MVNSRPENVNGILLLYHQRLTPDASTVMEHVGAFGEFSRFPLWSVNTFLGFPKSLRSLRFSAVVLHYSLFGVASYRLDEEFLSYLDECESGYKVAFFQDEFQHCGQRFAFIDRYKIDSIHTLVEPADWDATYRKYTRAPKVTYNIPGYVSDALIAAAGRLALPDAERAIDIGYRGRRLPLYMGRGAREKYDIAVGFKERAEGLGLKLDVEAEEQGRLYGDEWHRFMGNCRAVLGVEAGVSIYDPDDEVYREYCRAVLGEEAEPPGPAWYEQFTRLAERERAIDPAEVEPLLSRWEGNIPYRMISPRHFEAAAFRACQILFEGKYSGVMRPMEHYIPLKKDFSNFDEVIRVFRDERLRRDITENAHRDMIASGEYSYRAFLRAFDEELLSAGLSPELGAAEKARVTASLRADEALLRARLKVAQARTKDFPGRAAVAAVARPLLNLFRGARRGGPTNAGPA